MQRLAMLLTPLLLVAPKKGGMTGNAQKSRAATSLHLRSSSSRPRNRLIIDASSSFGIKNSVRH